LRFISWLLEPFTSIFKRGTQPSRIDLRVGGGRAALILVHGFSGNSRATWSGLIDFLLQEPVISTWDVYALGFPSSLRIDVPEVWAADPNLSLLAKELTTTLSLAPFRNYQALAIAAHSMGGLVVQRALVDDANLASRVGHAFFFGTPSGGLPKARLVSKLKRQFRDMSPASDFIIALRREWKEKYSSNLPFDLRVIAGDRDEFVPASSSLIPFEESVQAVVPGNHLGIVKPADASHQSVRIVVESLTGGRRALPPVDSARLAVELGQFKRAVEILLPRVSEIDDNAVVTLALALEGTNSSADVLQILETYCKGGISSSEALGALGGRLKRRWITGRSAADHARALELYRDGLVIAEDKGDFDQAFYHAINIAFLELMALPPASAISASCLDMARRALVYCEKCPMSQWRLATEGEALLMLGDLDAAVERYKQAISKTRSQREIDSMYSQAFRAAERVCGEEGVVRIENAFGLHR
jgi:tetratricopeptide (TPR) repeat protein